MRVKMEVEVEVEVEVRAAAKRHTERNKPRAWYEGVQEDVERPVRGTPHRLVRASNHKRDQLSKQMCRHINKPRNKPSDTQRVRETDKDAER